MSNKICRSRVWRGARSTCFVCVRVCGWVGEFEGNEGGEKREEERKEGREKEGKGTSGKTSTK